MGYVPRCAGSIQRPRRPPTERVGGGMITKPCRQFQAEDGEYILEWQFSGCVLELEVAVPGVFEFMFTPPKGEPRTITLDFNKELEDK